MFRRAAIIAAIVAAVGIVVYLVSPNPPAIVSELRALPQVAHVRYAGPANTALTVVQIRDFHIVPEEDTKLEELDFPALMDAVERVQADQMEIVRHLTARHDIKAVYVRGFPRTAWTGCIFASTC